MNRRVTLMVSLFSCAMLWCAPEENLRIYQPKITVWFAKEAPGQDLIIQTTGSFDGKTLTYGDHRSVTLTPEQIDQIKPFFTHSPNELWLADPLRTMFANNIGFSIIEGKVDSITPAFYFGRASVYAIHNGRDQHGGAPAPLDWPQKLEIRTGTNRVIPVHVKKLGSHELMPGYLLPSLIDPTQAKLTYTRQESGSFDKDVHQILTHPEISNLVARNILNPNTTITVDIAKSLARIRQEGGQENYVITKIPKTDFDPEKFHGPRPKQAVASSTELLNQAPTVEYLLAAGVRLTPNGIYLGRRVNCRGIWDLLQNPPPHFEN